jgi:transaldolase
VTSGGLAHYVREAAITGLTSNPAIFEKAIGGGHDYDSQAADLAQRGWNAEQVFFAMAIDDLRAAAALFEPTWVATQGLDGWVSLEVSPRLAADTEGSIAEAVALHAQAAIPNLFIKIPGTAQGLPAIEELTFRGVSINVTLLFSNEHYLAAADAYRRGIERRHAAGLPLAVPSVASIFVSRWDRATKGTLPDALQDKLGIAIAKQAYRSSCALKDSPAWRALQAEGGRPQRLLFASTGTKEASMPETYYVEALAAADTIDTMPQPTLDALIAGRRIGSLLGPGADDADALIGRISAAGIDIAALAAKLQADGAAAFVDSWDHLLASITAKMAPRAGANR